MSRLRKIFFYLFLMIYLVLCPVTILYALGYLFRPGGAQGIVKTGLIYLSTEPEGASVILGGRRYTKKTPAILRDLLPGNYPVTISRKNYFPWSRVLPVEAGKATALEKILLLPQQWNCRTLLPFAFDDLLPLEGTPFVLLMRGSRLGETLVYNWREEKFWPLLRSASFLDKARVLSSFTVPGSSTVVVHVDTQEGGERFLSVELNGKESTVEELTPFLQERPEQVTWDPLEKGLFFTVQGHTVNRIDLPSRVRNPFFLEGIAGIHLSNRTLTVLTHEGLLVQMDLDGKNVQRLTNEPLFQELFTPPAETFQIETLPRQTFLFLGDKGDLWMSPPPSRLIEDGVLGFKLHPRLEKVVFWQKGQIGGLDHSKGTEEERRAENESVLLWLFTEGKRIEQLFFAYEGSHLLFRDRAGVYLLELETVGKPRLSSVIDVKRRSSIFYSEESGLLYYLDRSSGYLSCLEILPRRSTATSPSQESPP